jgi:phosphodiesterase/alkaline phosphatase D-like protein
MPFHIEIEMIYLKISLLQTKLYLAKSSFNG